MKYNLFILISFLVVMAGCRKATPPQLPSNKDNTIDSTTFKLAKMNEALALKEDSLLGSYVEKNNLDYTKNQLGFWYKIEKTTKGDKIQPNSLVDMQYTLLSLRNDVFVDETSLVQLGKKNLTTGFEQGLLLMRQGESATFIVPWYLAFGIKGNGSNVDPYTSVIYKVTVINVK